MADFKALWGKVASVAAQGKVAFADSAKATTGNTERASVRELWTFFVNRVDNAIEALLTSVENGTPSLSSLGVTASELYEVLLSKTLCASNPDQGKKTARGSVRTLQTNLILNRRRAIVARSREEGRQGTSTYVIIPLSDTMPVELVEFLEQAVEGSFPMYSFPYKNILVGDWNKDLVTQFNRATPKPTTPAATPAATPAPKK